MVIKMASRRAAAQSQLPAPTEKKQSAKVSEVADRFLDDLNVPQGWRGLDHEELELVACILLQGIQPSLRPDLPATPITVYPGRNQSLKSLMKDFGRWPIARFVFADPKSGERKMHLLPRSSAKLQDALGNALKHLAPEELPPLFDMIGRKLTDRFRSISPGTPAPTSASVETPDTETQSRKMIEDDHALQLGRSLAQKTVTQGGIRYFPLSFAAPLAQAPETTLRDWINKKTKFAGRTIQTHTSPTNGLYVSEESVNRMAHRFIKWPSQEPAGRVTIGETDDQSGYVGLTDAARTIGVERHTMWRWATRGTAPTNEPLDVIKCPASDQFYISEKDVSDLKNRIPRAGLRRGPRAQLATQP